MDRAPLEPREIDQLQDPGHGGGDTSPLDPLPPQPIGHVVEHVEVGEQGVGLEHGVDVTFVRGEAGHVEAPELDLSLVRLLEPTDHPEGGRLPAARRSQEAEELAMPDVQGDLIDRHDVTEALPHPLEPDVGLWGRPHGVRVPARGNHRIGSGGGKVAGPLCRSV
jgi:hypothetical protein